MASIIKRKKAYSVVYSYTDERGETKKMGNLSFTQGSVEKESRN